MIEITRVELDYPSLRYQAPARVILHICFNRVIRHYITVEPEHSSGMGYSYDYKARESVFLNKAIDVNKLIQYGWSFLPSEYVEG